MTDQATTEDAGGVMWDAPNQQVVRDDHSPPWEEGTGGPDETPVADTDAPKASQTGSSDLDGMTKAQLLEYAQQLGVSPANNDMTKDELRAGVDAKLAAG